MTTKKLSPEELAEQSAETAAKLAEPEPAKPGATEVKESAMEKALKASRKRLEAAGQYVASGNEVTDSSPTFAGYDRAGDSQPVVQGKPADTAGA